MDWWLELPEEVNDYRIYDLGSDQLGSNKFSGMMGEEMNWVMTKYGW